LSDNIKIADDGATTAFFEGTWITLLLGALMFFPTLRTPKKGIATSGFFYWVAITWSLTPVCFVPPLMIYMQHSALLMLISTTGFRLTTTGAN